MLVLQGSLGIQRISWPIYTYGGDCEGIELAFDERGGYGMWTEDQFWMGCRNQSWFTAAVEALVVTSEPSSERVSFVANSVYINLAVDDDLRKTVINRGKCARAGIIGNRRFLVPLTLHTCSCD